MLDKKGTIIVKKFLVYGYNVHPEAIEILKNYYVNMYDINKNELDLIIKECCKVAKNDFIVTKEHVLQAMEIVSSIKRDSKIEEKKEKERDEKGKDEIKFDEVKVLKDVTGSSLCEGKLEDFLQYFRSRYEKIYSMLRGRVPAVPIARMRGEQVSVIGIVSDVRATSKGYMFELEDLTGSITCLAFGKASEVASTLLGDEVVAVTGTLKDKLIIVDRIVFPDIPINDGRRIQKDFMLAFISDTHFGSKKFLEKEWKDFVSWINGEESVKYLIVAGDIVDGVGIYPNQERELSTIGVDEQYEVAASHFDEIDKRIKIIISTGNHDAVRQAEPQPALPKEYRDLFPKNTIHVGNPCYISLEDVKVLIYHGRSLDDVVSKLHLSYDQPQKAMEELLKRRHLSPTYGERCPIAPEKEDYLVIDDVPDVIHCGHVHTHGVGFYRGVFLVNSSAWQAQTDFQKKMNFNPKPGIVTVYRPGGEFFTRNFCS